MAQSLELNIKTTSDVPQAMQKAKDATVSFDKQVQDIQKKFSTAFKDIFLGFTAPMVLLQSAIGFISGAIEEAKRNAKEGLDLISQGKTAFASGEEAKAAAFFKRKKELDDERKLVEAGRAEITRQILANEGGLFRDFNLPEKYVNQLKQGTTTMEGLAQNKEVQRLAVEYFTKTDEGRKLSESLGLNKPEAMKAPELTSNVIGVGASAQIMLAETANETLASIDSKLGQLVNEGIEKDPTKPLGRKYPIYTPGLSR